MSIETNDASLPDIPWESGLKSWVRRTTGQLADLILGSAAARNVGTGEGNVPVLGAGGLLDTGLISAARLVPSGGQAGQTLRIDDAGNITWGAGGALTVDALIQSDDFNRLIVAIESRKASLASAQAPSVFAYEGAKDDPLALPGSYVGLQRLDIATEADIRIGRAGAYALTLAAIEAANTPVAVTMSGAVTLDLNLGSVWDGALTANSTIAVFANCRAGASGVIDVTNAASYTATFVAAPGITLKAGGTLTAYTGAGALTRYTWWAKTATEIWISRANEFAGIGGGGGSGGGGALPTISSVTVTNDATTTSYGLWNTQFTAAVSSSGATTTYYQWKINGVNEGSNVAGGSTITPNRGTLSLTCLVTCTNANGSVYLESAPVTVLYVGKVVATNSPGSVPNVTSGTRTIDNYTVMDGQKFVLIGFGQGGTAAPNFTLNGNAAGSGGTLQIATHVPETNHRVHVCSVSDVTGADFQIGYTCVTQTVSWDIYQLVGYDVATSKTFGTDFDTDSVAASNTTAGSLTVTKAANACMIVTAKGWETLTDVDLSQVFTIPDFWASGIMSKLAADTTTVAATVTPAAALKIAAAVVFAKA